MQTLQISNMFFFTLQIVDPYCSKAPDGFASIEGLQPIMSLNIIKLDNVYLYSITVIPQNSSTIIIANSGDGFLRKVSCVEGDSYFNTVFTYS